MKDCLFESLVYFIKSVHNDLKCQAFFDILMNYELFQSCSTIMIGKVFEEINNFLKDDELIFYEFKTKKKISYLFYVLNTNLNQDNKNFINLKKTSEEILIIREYILDLIYKVRLNM